MVFSPPHSDLSAPMAQTSQELLERVNSELDGFESKLDSDLVTDRIFIHMTTKLRKATEEDKSPRSLEYVLWQIERFHIQFDQAIKGDRQADSEMVFNRLQPIYSEYLKDFIFVPSQLGATPEHATISDDEDFDHDFRDTSPLHRYNLRSLEKQTSRPPCRPTPTAQSGSKTKPRPKPCILSRYDVVEAEAESSGYTLPVRCSPKRRRQAEVTRVPVAERDAGRAESPLTDDDRAPPPPLKKRRTESSPASLENEDVEDGEVLELYKRPNSSHGAVCLNMEVVFPCREAAGAFEEWFRGYYEDLCEKMGFHYEQLY
ncbi:hypothetical protein DL96DRAFT_1630028, partial [Flagelloscypha sp. PMI_526]